ncbi:MAG: hypothetical protein AAGF31_12465 [Planctomycetota bacterium]
MIIALKAVGALALAAVVLTPLLYVFGQIELPTSNTVLITATIVWFAVAALPMFANGKLGSSES